MKGKGTIRRILLSRHFRSFLGVLLGILAACFLVVALVLFVVTSASLRRSLQTQLDNMTLSLSETLNTMRTNAVLLGTLKSVDTTTTLSSPELDDFFRVAEDVNSTMAVYSYRSVDVFFNSPRRAYVSQRGMYDYADYFGQDIIRLIDEQQPYEVWLTGRQYQPYYDAAAPVSVLTYLKRLPIYGSQANGYVALHFPMSELIRLIRDSAPACPGSFLVDFGGKVLYSNIADYPAGAAAPAVSALSSGAQAQGALLIQSSLKSDVRCSFFLPRTVLYRRALTDLSVVAGPFLLLLCFALLCAFGYSFLMIRPMEQILRQAGAPSHGGNEYEQLGRTIQDLGSCIDLLSDELKRNLPFIRERYILDLTTNYTELSASQAAYEEAGLSFPYEKFAVVLAECPPLDGELSYTGKEQLKLLISTQVEKQFSPLGLVYAANLPDERLLFLINTNLSDLPARLSVACKAACDSLLSSLAAAPTFSVGICPPHDKVPYHAYLQARSNIAFSQSLEGSEPLMPDQPAAAVPAIDEKNVRRITEMILAHELEDLRVFLRGMFSTILNHADEIESWRRLSTVCLCAALSQITELGLDIVPEQASLSIKKLARAATPDDCLELLLCYFSAVVSTEKKLPDEAETHVAKAVSYISQHYSENISIPQIADSVALHPIYLNKLFKLSTGKTLSDYLNFHRIEKAKELLRNTDLSLTAISERLGYNDARSLIRFFKKYNTISPSEYRSAQPGPGR